MSLPPGTLETKGSEFIGYGLLRIVKVQLFQILKLRGDQN